MVTEQQRETLLYFKNHADDWEKKNLVSDQINIIQQRNFYVLQVIKNRTLTKTSLDVGCGTGDLVYYIADLGLNSTGVDFSDTMIKIAHSKMQEYYKKNVSFHCASIFDFDLSGNTYDLISANGFIEYISLDELSKFLSLSYQALNPNGSLVIGSRNRLYNIVSMNQFTIDEMNLGTIPHLLKEAIALSMGATIEELSKIETIPLQDINTPHPNTGINVSTRYQFTPSQLIKIITTAGFEASDIYPIHIHGVPIDFKNNNIKTHANISNFLQKYANKNFSFLPYSSSFMLHAIKK